MANSPDALFYIAEQTSPDPSDNKVISLDVKKGPANTWWVEFDTCLHVFEFLNRNTRQYLGDNIMECLKADKIKSQMANNGWFGEMDHPFAELDGTKLSEKRVRTIYMPNRSHKIENPHRVGNRLMAHIQTSSGTEAGVGMAREIIQGLIPCFSARVFGVMQMIDGKPTIVVRVIVTYDWVLYPAFADAKAEKPAIAKSASLPVFESGDDLSYNSKDIYLPLSELADVLKNTDSGVGAYMESFEMDSTALKGFTKDGRAILQPDRDHILYPRIDKASVKRVHDFYKSFTL